MTSKEAARYIRLGVAATNRKAATGEIEARKLPNGQWRYTRFELEKYLDSKTLSLLLLFMLAGWFSAACTIDPHCATFFEHLLRQIGNPIHLND
jgi:hypothetical protein